MLKLFANKVKLKPQFIVNLLLVAYLITFILSVYEFDMLSF